MEVWKMFYLEDEKTLVLTKENKKDILKALEKINGISNDKNVKVAYIKILQKLLDFNKAIEDFYYSQKPEYNTVFKQRLDSFDNSIEEFSRTKATLKADFDEEGFVEILEKEFFDILNRVESRIAVLFEEEREYSFNNYLVTLINDKKLEEFIWLNTIYNIYKEGKSLKSIVVDYCDLEEIEFADLYKMYLFVTDYNINNLLLKDESKIINNDYLTNINEFFDYMYNLVDDMRNFVAKQDKKDILSFNTKIASYTNIVTPSKDEFLKIVRKVFNFLRAFYENDNSKLLLDNIYPVLVKSFFAPLKNDDKIKYDYNEDFIFALEYTQIIIEVMSEDND